MSLPTPSSPAPPAWWCASPPPPTSRSTRIEATLRPRDGDPVADARHALCTTPGACSRERADYGIEFDPRTGAPFVAVEDPQILPNGDYVLRLLASAAD